MRRIGSFVLREAKKAFPPTLFYLVIFHLSAMILHLDEKGLNMTPTQSGRATIAALILGKIYLVIEGKSFANCFNGKPLIFNTLWKTLIYWVLATLATALEEFLPVFYHDPKFGDALVSVLKDVSVSRFMATHLILLVSIFVFSALSELTSAIGNRKVWALFFGKRFFPE